MNTFSFYILPGVIGFIIVFGLFKNVPLFDTFILGAKDGLSSAFSIAPSLIGLIVAVSMLKASGALDIITSLLAPIGNLIAIPKETIPLMLLRPVSGSGALALVDSIFKSCGPDSFPGRVASVMMGSTETTFYVLAVYFGAVGIKNTRHTLPVALTADFASFILSVLTVRLFFS